MKKNTPKNPGAKIQKQWGGPVGAWNDQESVMLKSVLPNGEPVKLTSDEARNLARMLQILAEQADRFKNTGQH